MSEALDLLRIALRKHPLHVFWGTVLVIVVTVIALAVLFSIDQYSAWKAMRCA